MHVFFLEGPRGPLFSAYHPAVPRRRQSLGLVYVPPFAEEMNRSRRMAALQARRLAALGIDVLLLDPFGTGDSAGDFGDATWETWRADVRTAMEWLRPRAGGNVGLWGLRLGALLAADVATQHPHPMERLVLWQPVLSGERYLTQFLRLRLAATMSRGSDKETTGALRSRLFQGEVLEVAGYRLAPALAKAITGLKLQSLLESLGDLRLDWLEVASGDDVDLAPATRQLIGALEQRGQPLGARAVRGDSFWAIQELTLAPDLFRATEELFGT